MRWYVPAQAMRQEKEGGQGKLLPPISIPFIQSFGAKRLEDAHPH